MLTQMEFLLQDTSLVTCIYLAALIRFMCSSLSQSFLTLAGAEHGPCVLNLWQSSHNYSKYFVLCSVGSLVLFLLIAMTFLYIGRLVFQLDMNCKLFYLFVVNLVFFFFFLACFCLTKVFNYYITKFIQCYHFFLMISGLLVIVEGSSPL